jgi:hypothetical protein
VNKNPGSGKHVFSNLSEEGKASVSFEVNVSIYTEGNRRNGPDFGRVFLRSYYTDITQNTYIQSSMVTEILTREV